MYNLKAEVVEGVSSKTGKPYKALDISISNDYKVKLFLKPSEWYILEKENKTTSLPFSK